MAGKYRDAMADFLAEINANEQQALDASRPVARSKKSEPQRISQPIDENMGNSAINTLRAKVKRADQNVANIQKSRKNSRIFDAVESFGDFLPFLESTTERVKADRDATAQDVETDIQDILRSREEIKRSGGFGKGGYGAAVQRGLGNLQSMKGGLEAGLGIADEESIGDIIQGRARAKTAGARNRSEQEAYERFQAADGLVASAREIFTNYDLLTNVAVESLPSSLPSIVGGAAAGVVGGVVTRSGEGAKRAASVGTGIGSFVTEYGNTMLETFSENGVNLDDPQALKTAFADKELMSEARARGARRGIAVGAFDMMSVWFAGRMGGAPVARTIIGDTAKAGLARKATGLLAAGAVETVGQGTLGAAGEAAGQLAADGRITSPQDIVAEFAGEIPTGAVESSFGTAMELRKEAKANDPNRRENSDLASWIYAREQANAGGQNDNTPAGGGALADPNTTMRVAGFTMTPTQLLEFAETNTSNPRIADIMSQPVLDTVKADQVARILNEQEAALVEPEAVRRISSLIGGTIPTSQSRQFITEELSKIADEVVEASATLTAIRDTVATEKSGKQFVGTLRGIVENYSPSAKQGEAFVGRPERFGQDSAVITQDQVSDEAQRERNAPYFLNPDVYGAELGGTEANLIGFENGKFRIQYDSPTEVGRDGSPVMVSEDVDRNAILTPDALEAQRNAPQNPNRLPVVTQSGQVNQQQPNVEGLVEGQIAQLQAQVEQGQLPAPTGTTAALPAPVSAAPTQQALPAATLQAAPTQTALPAPAEQQALPAPTQQEAAPIQLPAPAQDTQTDLQPNVEGIVQAAPPQQVAPTQPALPAPAVQQALPAPAPPPPPAPAPKRETPPAPKAVEPAATEEDVVVEDEEVDVDNDPRMVEHNQRFDDAIESIQDTENATEVRKLAKKLIREGVIDEDAYADIDERMKDVPLTERWDEGMSALEDAIEEQRDSLASDIEEEIYSEADEKASSNAAESTDAKQDVHNELTDAEKDVLADHYGEPEYNGAAKTRFIEDLVTAVNKGLQSVDKKIRAIVKRISLLTLSAAVVFSPMSLTGPSIPQARAQDIAYNETLHRAVPVAARGKMSVGAQRVYETMAPVATQNGKSFFIADKPNGMIHAFAANGSYMASAPSLYGKAAGDVLTEGRNQANGTEDVTDSGKVTPAGTFKLEAGKGSYTGGYVLYLVDPKTGVGVGANKAGGGAIVAVHSVYNGTASESREGRLDTDTANDNKISFGCINTAEEFFVDNVRPNIESFDGGMVFVMPDDVSQTSQLFPSKQRKGSPANPSAPSQPAAPADNAARPTRKEPERRVGDQKDGKPEETDVQETSYSARSGQAANDVSDNAATDIDYDAKIEGFLQKIAAKGRQGKVIAARLRTLLDNKSFNAAQKYYAFRMGEVMATLLPKGANVDIDFVSVLFAKDKKAAENSGTTEGSETSGSYTRRKETSAGGFRGLITLSLAPNMMSATRENAAHEAFHVVQDILKLHYPEAYALLNNTFKDGMTLNELDPSILRKLKTLSHRGNVSVFDDLKAVFGEEQTFSANEAQAIAFGALMDAKERGQSMKGLKATYIRLVDMLSDFRRAMGNLLRKEGIQSPADILSYYASGKPQESMTETAPLLGEIGDASGATQYSARRYSPDKGIDSAIQNLKEDITDVGGEVLDATSIDQLISSDQIPVITVKDLIGKKIFATISDRTAAAALYTGIDSSKTVAIPLLGGPNFPLRMSSAKDLLAWANRGGAILTKKMKKVSEGANYMMVVMGSADMHQSNTTVNNAYFATLEAYARDGRINGDAAEKLTTMIRSAKDADPRIKKYLEEFPSFSDVDALDKYIHRVSFEARKRIMTILDSKAALELGAPSLKQILDATREPSMAGHRWGDGVLVLELIGDGVVSLGENGTQAHPDFPLGLKGRVVGRLETPVNYELLWQDFLQESKRKTKSRGKTPTAATARYDFQQSLPVVEVTQELADKIGDLSAPNIDSARQARLASDMAAANWRTSDQAKVNGGVSTQEFVDAINNSAAKSVLNEYATKDVNADIKAEKMRVFQLGNDGQIFFALKKGDPQYSEDYGIDIPMISKDEVMVTAVINNEQGARGIAGPAVMLKAIEEGATVLDCFAVKTKKFPNGFLPALYEAFGFTKVAEVPFDPQYYAKQKLDDAVKYWQDSSAGYNAKTDGYPPLVIMKWTGTDEQRQGVLNRYLQSGIEGLFEGRDFSPARDAVAKLRGASSNASGEVGPAAVSERTGGAEGVGAGASVASRARAVVEEIAGLSDQQLTNLGLTNEDRLNAQTRLSDVQYSGRTGRAVYTPERTEQIISSMADPKDGNKSKSWMTFMSPDEFLGLTLSRAGRDILATMDPTKTRARKLDIDDLRQVSEPLFLSVKEAAPISVVQRQLGVTSLPWQVFGHEGRHRMAAFKDAGITQVPVVLMRQDGATQLEDIANISLAPQRGGRSDQYNNGDTSIDVGEAIPISNNNADRIRDMMEGEGVQFSARRGGDYDGPDILNPSRLTPAPSFTDTNRGFAGIEPNKLDYVIYNLQDKFVDLKRVQENITKTVGEIDDNFNTYQREELSHGRGDQRSKNFLKDELSPLIKEMKAKGVSLELMDKYLHANHAKERNAQNAKINDKMPDGGSGMTNAEADAFFSGLPNVRRRQLETLASRVYAIEAKTNEMRVDYKLEKQSTIDTWNSTYQNYVPLQREGFEEEGISVGAGISVRGGSSKRALGSSLGVVNVLANIAMQREAVITRGEKNRVTNALGGMALKNPNDSYWFVIDPKGFNAEAAKQKLIDFGMTPPDAENVMAAPTERYIDPRSGRVVYRPNSRFMNAPNVIGTRVDGEDMFIIFNSRLPRAKRLVETLKGLNTKEFNWLIRNNAKLTRYIGAINTQFNPIWGLYNFTRDLQGAALNLTSTPLNGKQGKILLNAFPALAGMYSDLRAERSGKTASSRWASLAEEFMNEGAQTGFRDLFATSTDRAKAIENELTGGSLARRVGGATAGPMLNFLSDSNGALENAVRLAAYKEALDMGISKPKAASIAKNLTVNFNRKGVQTGGMATTYAFFNASVQGAARMAQTLATPTGKKIITAGLLLGVAQAIALSAAGLEKEPEWKKDKNLLIPTGDGKYIPIPMTLGYHALPAIGRRVTEYLMSGGENTGEAVVGLLGMLADAFNPLGNAGLSLQTIAPSTLDWAAALEKNEDFAGRKIYQENMNGLDPASGPSRNREGVSAVGAFIAEAIDTISGGNGYVGGAISPTGDAVDYFIGQWTGGVGREILNATSYGESLLTGEDIPNYKIPLVGKLMGDSNEAFSVSNRFYESITEMNGHKRTIKGLQEDGKGTGRYLRDNPEARIYMTADKAESSVSKLNKRRKALKARGAPQSSIDSINDRRMKIMEDYLKRVERYEQ